MCVEGRGAGAFPPCRDGWWGGGAGYDMVKNVVFIFFSGLFSCFLYN